MRISLTRVLVIAAVIVWLLVLFGTAAASGFFGTMFEGFAGGMFGDMFGSTIESVTGTTGSSSVSSTTRPLATPTVRR